MKNRIYLLLILLFSTQAAHSQWQLDTKHIVDLTFDRLEALTVQTDSKLLYKFQISTRYSADFLRIKDTLTATSHSIVGTKVLHTNEHQTEMQVILESVSVQTRSSLVSILIELRDLTIPVAISSITWSVETTDGNEIIPDLETFRERIATVEDSSLFKQGTQLRHFYYNDYAAVAFDECVKRNYLPEVSCAYLAECYRLLKRNDLAIASFERGLIYNPNSLEILINLGYAYSINGETDSALATFKRVLELDPENTACLYNVGTFLFEKEEYELAKPHFEKLHNLEPTNRNATYFLDKIKEMGL